MKTDFLNALGRLSEENCRNLNNTDWAFIVCKRAVKRCEADLVHSSKKSIRSRERKYPRSASMAIGYFLPWEAMKPVRQRVSSERPKKRKKRLVIRVRPHRPRRRFRRPQGNVLVRRYDYFAEHPDADEVPEEKERFTFKLCCLVELSYKYTVSFARHDEVQKDTTEPSILSHAIYAKHPRGYDRLHEKVVVMRALGDVHFISVDCTRCQARAT